jgi:hypothetical protein
MSAETPAKQPPPSSNAALTPEKGIATLTVEDNLRARRNAFEAQYKRDNAIAHQMQGLAKRAVNALATNAWNESVVRAAFIANLSATARRKLKRPRCS